MIQSLSSYSNATQFDATSQTSRTEAAANSGASSSSSDGLSGADALASEQTFLQLFVAQLQNQDPTSPQDPVQFVTQLAQFSGLEQSLQMRQDLDAILKQMQTPQTTTTQG